MFLYLIFYRYKSGTEARDLGIEELMSSLKGSIVGVTISGCLGADLVWSGADIGHYIIATSFYK